LIYFGVIHWLPCPQPQVSMSNCTSLRRHEGVFLAAKQVVRRKKAHSSKADMDSMRNGCPCRDAARPIGSVLIINWDERNLPLQTF
jgi:hypothetical protein